MRPALILLALLLATTDGRAQDRHTSPRTYTDRASERSAPPSATARFRCMGKPTCKKMASCEEAYFHLEQCGARRLDRDRDGIPCESICKGR